jgi:hypothetical protein
MVGGLLQRLGVLDVEAVEQLGEAVTESGLLPVGDVGAPLPPAYGTSATERSAKLRIGTRSWGGAVWELASVVMGSSYARGTPSESGIDAPSRQ